MRNEDKRNYMIGWLFVCTVAGFLWLALLLLKVFGAITWGWPATLLSVLWLPLLVGLVFFGLVALSVAISDTKAKRERRKRQKAVDRRIIAQAKAIGAWDKRPTPLGGRALELKAWEDFKIKRAPGETDWELRRRCMAAADNELAEAGRRNQ